MVKRIIMPSEEEVQHYLLGTLQHVFHVEYFLDKLKIGHKDKERPHDIIGVGNKFEWDIINGLALQYKYPKVDFDQYIKPALTQHRQQYHHRMWNEPNPDNKKEPTPGASPEDLKVGAVDANCSMLENRVYQGGAHSYDEIEKGIGKNKKDLPYTISPLKEMLAEMRALKQPNIKRIHDIKRIPNIGVPKETYERIIERTKETLSMLRADHKYLLR